jgi:hypothetical protein
MATYLRKLHMGVCPRCCCDALTVYLYALKDGSQPFACCECVWARDPDADLDHTEEAHDH